VKLIKFERPETKEILQVADKVGDAIRMITEETGCHATSMMVVVTLSDGSALNLEAGEDVFRLVGALASAQHSLLNETE
jgi:hypothetical protein